MTTEVITVKPDQNIEEVARLLSNNKISGLPVVDTEGRLVGVITENDLIHRARTLHIPFYVTLFDSIIFLENPVRFNEDLKKLGASRVEEIMTKKVTTVEEDTPVSEIARTMTEKSINRVPVVRDGKLVGIVSRNDIVRSLVK